jgi:alkanesulfonate monooxygenase SsuD/methylene tetrahydromethanopterin reductase-like flavin-dependent oxidoreductase (luciferase family)
MELRRLGESGLRVSYLCLGAGMFGNPSTVCNEHVATEIVIDDGYLSQPLTFASALAVRTRRVRLGTAVLLAGLRHPLQLAEEAALVDVLSDGRLGLGVGSGYRVPEFAAFGVDHRRRYTVLQQTVESVISYWSSGSVVPKPIQEPLPLWGGFFGQRGLGLPV